MWPLATSYQNKKICGRYHFTLYASSLICERPKYAILIYFILFKIYNATDISLRMNKHDKRLLLNHFGSLRNVTVIFVISRLCSEVFTKIRRLHAVCPSSCGSLHRQPLDGPSYFPFAILFARKKGKRTFRARFSNQTNGDFSLPVT